MTYPSANYAHIRLSQWIEYWRLSNKSIVSIKPNALWNHEFENKLLKEDHHGDWILNTRHPWHTEYWNKSFESVCIWMLYRTALNKPVLFLGYTGGLEACALTGTNIEVLAIVTPDSDFTTSYCDAISILNQSLDDAYRTSWGKRLKRCRIQAVLQLTDKPKIALATPTKTLDAWSPIYGTNAWWLHGTSLTGLLVDAHIAWTWTKRWTACAIDLLLNGSTEHQLQLKTLWPKEVLSKAVCKKVHPNLHNILHVLHQMDLTDAQWLDALTHWKSDTQTGSQEIYALPLLD